MKIIIESISQQDNIVKASINIGGHNEIVTTLFNKNCIPYISIKILIPMSLAFYTLL